MTRVIRRRKVEDRICPKCGDSKPLTEAFWYRNWQMKNGFQSWCKLCMILWNRARAAEHVRFIRAIKESTPCMDCGHKFPSYVMDFDHRPDEIKCGDISKMIYSSRPLETILAEIAKCDLVCGNCHRIRTRKRDEAAKAARLNGVEVDVEERELVSA